MISIKICGLTDPSNVKEIGDLHPDFAGFIFIRQSLRYVGNEPDPALFRNLPPDTKKTGVFLNESHKEILDIAKINGLEAIQLHGDESHEDCLILKSSGLRVIKAFNIDNDFDFKSIEEYTSCCDFFLFDARTELRGGSGKKFDWAKLTGYTGEKPFFLSGGICADDADTIKSMSVRGLYGVDVNSRFEVSPGIKDAALVSKFMNKIKS